MLLVSETYLTEDINDCELKIDGYKCYRSNSNSTHTDGVASFVLNGHRHKILNSWRNELNNWMMRVEYVLQKNKWNISVVYHSPSASDAAMMEDFSSWKEIVCEGDSNILKTCDLIYTRFKKIVMKRE